MNFTVSKIAKQQAQKEESRWFGVKFNPQNPEHLESAYWFMLDVMHALVEANIATVSNIIVHCGSEETDGNNYFNLRLIAKSRHWEDIPVEKMPELARMSYCSHKDGIRPKEFPEIMKEFNMYKNRLQKAQTEKKIRKED